MGYKLRSALCPKLGPDLPLLRHPIEAAVAALREDVFPALGVSISAAARELGVARQTLHRILQESTSITPDMAVRLGKYCGNGPDIWLQQKVVKAIPDRSRKAA